MDANDPNTPAIMESIDNQLLCLRNLISRWEAGEFGNVSCIDERTFTDWYEKNCFMCY